MSKGETTTIRESNKPELHVQIILWRNASPMELMQAQIQQPGRTFQIDGHTYCITGVELDEIKRLIATGTLMETPVVAPEYPILQPIAGNKWAARGDGWAVHGATREEAIENYRKAELKHQEILARPSRQKE